MASVINHESNMKLQKIMNTFPEEMLLKIFGFLDFESLKKMTLINQRWYFIVTNATSTMKKLPLNIYGDMLRNNTVGYKKFYKVVFYSTYKSFNVKMLSKLKTIGSNIREIEFIDCSIGKPKEVRNILRNFPNVKKLTFTESSFRSRSKKLDTEVLELKNLKELVMNESCLMILSSIEAQLRSLKVRMPDVYEVKEIKANEQQLVKFLYTQKKLETLELYIEDVPAIFDKIEIAEYQFKLKELSIHSLDDESEFKFKNLKDFLYLQKDSVEILELGFNLSNDIYELILNKFENLKTLRIDASAFPTDLNFYKRIRANKNNIKLTIEGYFEDSDQCIAFLSIFTNVTDITFSRAIPFEVLSRLPKYCKALTSLSLNRLCRGNFKDVKFPALKNLQLENFESGNGWKDLVLSNRTIESLSLKNMYNLYSFDANEIKTVCEELPNFKHLKLDGNLKQKLYHFQNHIDTHPDKFLLKIFSFLDSESLKSLTLVNKSLHDIVTNDTSLMKKLPLLIRDDKLTKKPFIVGNRKFYKVVFKSINENFDTEMLTKLKVIGTNIREIEFIDCCVCEPKEFQNSLRNFPEVEKLTFDNCWFRNPYDKSNVEVLKLGKLKDLVLQDCCLMILSCFVAQLKSLKFNMLYFDEHTEKAANKQQLMKFLYAQKDSVEILELGINFSNDDHGLILNTFENVKTLRISISTFPTDLSFYKSVRANKNVSKLIVNGVILKTVQYCTFLSLFPNVTDISFSSGVPFQVLNWLPICCNSLTSLSLYKLCPGKYENIKFSGLKNFNLECFGNGWSNLVMSNRTIESLSFRSLYRVSDFDAYELKMVCKLLPNLKHLELSGGMKDELYHLKNIKKSIQILLS